MKINTREKNDVIILDLEGDIDIDAGNLLENTGWIMGSKTNKLILNFENVNLVDYVGVSLLAVIYKNTLNHQGKMEIYNVPGHVKRLFSIVGLDRIFTYHNSEEEAIRTIAQERPDKDQQPLRRRFKRVPINLEIKYRPKISQEKEWRKGKIINLSGDGVFVSTRELFPVGQNLETIIALTPKPGLLEIDARVVWLSDKDLQPNDFPGMGLEFENIKGEIQKMIITFVEKHLTHSSQ